MATSGPQAKTDTAGGGQEERADSTFGYESPTEENNLCFGAAPRPGPPMAHEFDSVRLRPQLLSRPSQMAAVLPSDSNALQYRGTSSGMDNIMSRAEKFSPNGKVGIKDRISCYQWTYFTMTMATGGVANVMWTLEYNLDWINGVGLFFFILNIVLFLINCVCLTIRFSLVPGSFRRSFTDQFESLFIPAFFVSIAIIMINICEYGADHAGFWLLRTMQIMFWAYIALSVLASTGMYLILWSTQVFPVHMMTPTWVFPAYPLLLTAPLATNLVDAADRTGRLWLLNKPAIAVCAVTTQGTGCLIAFMISAAFIYRLMTQKLPRDLQRPGVFISIGPFGFTAAGIVQLGRQADILIPKNFLGSPVVVDIFKVVSVLAGLWLWGLSMWFFLVSVGSLWKYVRSGNSMPFQMTWWSFVFPNTALVTATQSMGRVFENQGLQLCGCVMTAILVIVWIYVFLTMLYCLGTRRLLYPKTSK